MDGGARAACWPVNGPSLSVRYGTCLRVTLQARRRNEIGYMTPTFGNSVTPTCSAALAGLAPDGWPGPERSTSSRGASAVRFPEPPAPAA